MKGLESYLEGLTYTNNPLSDPTQGEWGEGEGMEGEGEGVIGRTGRVNNSKVS